MNPSVAIVIVNFNGADFIMRSIESALAQVYDGPCEVVVVDNASTDRSLEVLQRVPGIRVIAHHSNGGFGAGANVALAATNTDYVAFLNPDARAAPGWLAKMIPFMRDGDVTLASSIISAGPDTYFASGRYVASLGVSIDSHRPHEETDWLTGCALVASRRALELLGGFDEAFFLYYEDVDLSLRARERGLRIRVLNERLVDHPDKGSSTNALGRKKMEIIYRSRGRLIAKHVARWNRYAALGAALTLVLRNGITPAWFPAIARALFAGFYGALSEAA